MASHYWQIFQCLNILYDRTKKVSHKVKHILKKKVRMILNACETSNIIMHMKFKGIEWAVPITSNDRPLALLLTCPVRDLMLLWTRAE